MKKKENTQIKYLYDNSDNIYFIHYSCQNLSDDNEGYSPRITSIAVLHMKSDQMYSFSIHLEAEELKINRDQIFEEYDQIEERMLNRFFQFAETRSNEAIWIHWNMTNINFGFETLEHRYRVLSANTPFHISEKNRYNLSKLLSKRYGPKYANDPKMLNLMELNGGRQRSFLKGDEEVSAYKAKEFVKLHNSTMCKVYFFKSVFNKMIHNNLITATNQFRYKVNMIYQNPIVQLLGIIGVVGTIISLIISVMNWL